ncbi:hypothetical protein BS17DRAFT_838243 [Gyrodon lividus]|nr:hypothetical protein BS17DRAFT_838243 [Gyrodon lividus]
MRLSTHQRRLVWSLVWVMCYWRVMGFGYEIPANQVGKLKMLWVIREYGFYHVCVIRESTVVQPLGLTCLQLCANMSDSAPRELLDRLLSDCASIVLLASSPEVPEHRPAMRHRG